MGADIACPCDRRTDTLEIPKMKMDVVEMVMKGKLLEENLLFEYSYDQTKVCLIKTEQIEGFFNNRKFFRIKSKMSEINYYFNSVFITNFLAKKDLALIMLQYTPGLPYNNMNNENTQISKKSKGKNSKFDTMANNYKVELINLVSNDKVKVKEHILHDLSLKMKKNYLFLGILNDGRGLERNFRMCYKKNLKKDIDVLYDIFLYEGQLDEENLKYILGENRFKYKALKSIMIDSNSTNTSSNLV
jgi:hypothetical protein